MTDDPARAVAVAAVEPEPIPVGEPEPVAAPFLQITEVEATPLDADDMLERRDPFGRVPVVVRVRRQPPIKVEWILIAIALGASGVLLPLFFALRAVIIVAAIAALVVGVVTAAVHPRAPGRGRPHREGRAALLRARGRDPPGAAERRADPPRHDPRDRVRRARQRDALRRRGLGRRWT